MTHLEIIKTASELTDIPELHDRLIAATAKYFDIPLITNDKVLGILYSIICPTQGMIWEQLRRKLLIHRKIVTGTVPLTDKIPGRILGSSLFNSLFKILGKIHGKTLFRINGKILCSLNIKVLISILIRVIMKIQSML